MIRPTAILRQSEVTPDLPLSRALNLPESLDSLVNCLIPEDTLNPLDQSFSYFHLAATRHLLSSATRTYANTLHTVSDLLAHLAQCSFDELLHDMREHGLHEDANIFQHSTIEIQHQLFSSLLILLNLWSKQSAGQTPHKRHRFDALEL